MSYNTKNYTEQGGDVTHIGGKLIMTKEAPSRAFPSLKTRPRVPRPLLPL